MAVTNKIYLDDLVQKIADSLAHCDLEYIAKIANEVLPEQTVAAIAGDDEWFEITDKD